MTQHTPTVLYDINGVEFHDGDFVISVHPVPPEIAPEAVHRMRGTVEREKHGMWMVALDPANEPPELSHHWTPLWPPEAWQIADQYDVRWNTRLRYRRSKCARCAR